MTRRGLLGGATLAGAGLALPRSMRAEPLTADLDAGVTPHGSRTTDVVVVGAGLAGLAAARRLRHHGLDVVVLEARRRVGGRTLTYRFDDGTVLDVGGQWIGPLPGQAPSSTFPGQEVRHPQSEIYRLAHDLLGLRTFHTYDKGAYVQVNGGQRVTYHGRIPPDPGDINGGYAIFTLNEMAKQVDPEKPWSKPTAAQARIWDGQTVETWMRENFTPPNQNPGSATYALATLAIESVTGPCEPRDVSLLDVLVGIASAGNIDNMINTSSGAQDSRFARGAQQIAIELAKHLGDHLVLDAPVRRITQHHRPGRHHVTVSGDGFDVHARAVVVAIPPPLTGKIHFEPSLATFDGGLRDQLVQRMPMGSTIKVQAIYKHPYWRRMGLAGQATSDEGPIKTTFDNTPFQGSQAATDATDAHPGVLVGFIDAQDAREWGLRSKAARRKVTFDTFARYFPGGPDPIGYVEMNWSRQRYTGGCYNSYMPPGVWTGYGRAVAKPLGRVHWASSDISPRWTGYMDGAVRMGERAARAVMAQLA